MIGQILGPVAGLATDARCKNNQASSGGKAEAN